MNEIFKQQQDFQKLIGSATEFISAYEKIKACNIQLRRAEDEIKKAIRELPYDLSGYGKFQKSLTFNKYTVLQEIVDAQLFMINVLNICGISYEDFKSMCQQKQKKNVDRYYAKERFTERKDNTFIVIEGPDGVGKTSICKSLSDLYNIPVLRMPDPEKRTENNIEDYADFYRNILSQLTGTYILDRYYPSSIVYSDFFNRDRSFELYDTSNTFIFIIDREVPYRDDHYITTNDWYKIRKIYLEKAKLFQWKIISNSSTLENCVEQIIAELQF